MPFTIVVDEDFSGPPLEDLLPVLDELSDPVEVSWEGTSAELRLYERNENRTFLFMVKDNKVLDRTLWALGGSIPLTPEEITASKTALTNRNSQDWRSGMESLGYIRGMLVLTKLTGDSLRSGKKPIAIARTAIDCLRGVNPLDADLLIRLRTSK